MDLPKRSDLRGLAGELDDDVALTSLAPEQVTAYEAGVKTTLDSRHIQLDGSVFHYVFTNGIINVGTGGGAIWDELFPNCKW